MTAGALLGVVVGALDTAGVPFMLTGSLAAAFHGAGRATMDIDLVIDPSPPQLRILLDSLAATRNYVSREAALDALHQRGMFNVIDPATGWKADLIVRKDRPFSNAELARRQRAEFEGCQLWVATVEDVILSKLEWASLGGSARQLEDVAALLTLHEGTVDREYLERWVVGLDLGVEWSQVTGTDQLTD